MLGLSIACAAAALAWVYLVAGHGGFWRTSQRLPRFTAEPQAWPDVTAVVPARNEAAMLPATLPALLGQDYPGALAVLVVDDGSTDGTDEVAARIARSVPALSAGGDRTMRVIPGVPPPAGERWAGKVWAMAQGLQAPPTAGGRSGLAETSAPAGFVLFTDADIAWQAPDTLRRLVAAAEGDDRDLVSQM